MTQVSVIWHRFFFSFAGRFHSTNYSCLLIISQIWLNLTIFTATSLVPDTIISPLDKSKASILVSLCPVLSLKQSPHSPKYATLAGSLFRSKGNQNPWDSRKVLYHLLNCLKEIQISLYVGKSAIIKGIYTGKEEICMLPGRKLLSEINFFFF